MKVETPPKLEEHEIEIVKLLLENGKLTGAANGIAKQALSHGRETLSRPQEAVFRQYVDEEYFQMSCGRCSNSMETSEIVEALERGDDYCNWCLKMSQNLKKE